MFVPFAMGRYTVVDSIRYGGMGEVLKAQRVEDDGTITTWAVKRPLPTVAEDPELLGLFWKETELMQKMRNAAFPAVEEVGVSQSIPFMVMEYVPGCSVQDLRQRHADAGHSPIRAETWVLLASDLATAVADLHRFKRGNRVLVHGDVRGANVLVDPAGQVRLVDLGLALANDTLWRRLLRSRGNELPAFLRDSPRGPEFDTWSIGRLLVECLGGQAIFEQRSRVPQGLVEVLRKATDPSGMYAFKSARTFKWELQSYLAQDRLDSMRQDLARLVSG